MLSVIPSVLPLSNASDATADRVPPGMHLHLPHVQAHNECMQTHAA